MYFIITLGLRKHTLVVGVCYFEKLPVKIYALTTSFWFLALIPGGITLILSMEIFGNFAKVIYTHFKCEMHLG